MIILEKRNYDAFICNIAKKFRSEVFGKPHTLNELFGWFLDGFINFPVISIHMIMRHFMCFLCCFLSLLCFSWNANFLTSASAHIQSRGGRYLGSNVHWTSLHTHWSKGMPKPFALSIAFHSWSSVNKVES